MLHSKALGFTLGLGLGALSLGGAEAQDAMNAREWQTAAEILELAKAKIEQNGWQQGEEQAVNQECLSTAVERAFFEKNTQSIVDFNYAIAALNEQLGFAPDEYVAASESSLDVPYWGSALMNWNDTPDRTEEDVVNILQNAADAARKKAEASQ